MDPKQLEALVDQRISAALESRGVSKGAVIEWLKLRDNKVSEGSKLSLTDRLIRQNGFTTRSGMDAVAEAGQSKKDQVLNEHRISYMEMADALTTTEATLLIPRVISRIVREAVEPVIVPQNLFRRLRIPGLTTIAQFPSIGGMHAEDIPEGGEYPDQKLEGAGYAVAKIGKVGLKTRFTEEVQRYTSFDLITLHARAAGRALVRHKEKKCATAITDNAVVSFDNSGGSSLNGNTQGRNLNLAGNDTIILSDIFQMYADLVNAGFMPTDFILNPIAWLIFARDATMRAWAFQNGGTLFQPVEGEPGRGVPDDDINLGPTSGGGSTFGTINQATTQRQMFRTTFPTNIGMVVSPFMPFDTSAKTVDIVLADRDEIGALVEDEPITMDRWEDPSRDVLSMKWRERYGLAVLNDGEGMVMAKGVSIAKGFDFESNVNLSIQATGEPVLPGIPNA